MAHRRKFIVEYNELKSSLKTVPLWHEDYLKAINFNKAKKELINLYKGRIAEWKAGLARARKLKSKDFTGGFKHVQKRRKRKDAGENCVPLRDDKSLV